MALGKDNISPIDISAKSSCFYSTWSWGNKFLWRYSQDQDDELRKTYDYLLRNGVSWFDTADSYGTGGLAGRSESLLGQFYQESGRKGSFCTKIAPFPWIVGQEAITSNVLASQRRLQCPIDMLQLHWPPTFGWQENAYLDSFAEAIEGGIATQVGLSNFGPKGLRVIVEKLRQRNLAPYTNQVQFSMLCRQPLQNGLVEACREWNIQPISYSPLALGLLTDTYSLDNLPKGPRALLFREFLPVMSPLLQELRAIACTRGKTVAQVALNWNLQKGFLVLVGVRSVQQVQIVGSVDMIVVIADYLSCSFPPYYVQHVPDR